MTIKNNNCNPTDHPSYKKEITRVNKIVGQLEGIKSMIESEKYCINILMQLKAVRSAIHSLEVSILKSHLDNCVKSLLGEDAKATQKIDELLELFKKADFGTDCIACCTCVDCQCKSGAKCKDCGCEDCKCCS